MCHRARNLVPRSGVIERALTNCNCVFAHRGNPTEANASKTIELYSSRGLERDISKEMSLRGRDDLGGMIDRKVVKR